MTERREPISLDDMIEYRAHRLATFENARGYHPRAEQRARTERRMLKALVNFKRLAERSTTNEA